MGNAVVEENTKLAKLLQGLKRDLGAVSVSQGYKGTGSRAYRRQVFVRFKNGLGTDLWLAASEVQLGGVLVKLGVVPKAATPEETYMAVREALRPLAERRGEP